MLVAVVDDRICRAVGSYRLEPGRAASVLALSLAAALLAFASLAFLALTVMVALAALAVVAAVLVRRPTATAVLTRRD